MGASASARRKPARVQHGTATRRSRRLTVTPELLAILQQKVALTLAEAEALGLGTQRDLRQKVADGAIRRAVVWQGVGTERKRFRLLRTVLLEELQEARR